MNNNILKLIDPEILLHGGERMAPNAKVAQTAHYMMVDALKRAFKL
ncbi:MAG: hypothetical protein HC892_23300 [Saprospiraceae bacterium]|nr:hypothetical protein [Saprospiraceae bacterium]